MKTSLICIWTKGWANNQDAVDLRCHHAHYDVTLMGQNLKGKNALSSSTNTCIWFGTKRSNSAINYRITTPLKIFFVFQWWFHYETKPNYNHLTRLKALKHTPKNNVSQVANQGVLEAGIGKHMQWHTNPIEWAYQAGLNLSMWGPDCST